MTSALIHVHGAKRVHPLVADLEAAGIQVLGIAGDRNKLVQEVVRHAPDLVICDAVRPLSVPSNTPLLQRNPTAALKLALGLSLVFNLRLVFWLLFLHK